MQGRNLLARVTRVGVTLSKVHWSEAEQGQVQHVQPNNRLITFVAVVMPVPDRCDNNISSNKRHLLSLDSSETFTIHDEATGKGKMSVCWGSLARVDDLQAAIDGVCSIGGL